MTRTHWFILAASLVLGACSEAEPLPELETSKSAVAVDGPWVMPPDTALVASLQNVPVVNPPPVASHAARASGKRAKAGDNFMAVPSVPSRQV